MDPQTLALILQLLQSASALVPVVTVAIQTIQQQSGKSVDQIFAEAGVQFQQNDLLYMQIMAGLGTPVTPAA